MQSASWTLREQVRFDKNRHHCRSDWDELPDPDHERSARASTTVLIDRPNEQSLGAGEASQGPTAAAIGNAFAAATGRRIRELPLHPDRVRAALA